jgi:hypothetical protein
MNKQLQDNVAIVTGASNGSAASLPTFAAEGARPCWSRAAPNSGMRSLRNDVGLFSEQYDVKTIVSSEISSKPSHTSGSSTLRITLRDQASLLSNGPTGQSPVTSSGITSAREQGEPILLRASWRASDSFSATIISEREGALSLELSK